MDEIKKLIKNQMLKPIVRCLDSELSCRFATKGKEVCLLLRQFENCDKVTFVDEESKVLRNHLKKILNEQGIPKRTFCEDLGIDRSHFSRFLNGKTNFSLENLVRIAEYLGYRIDFVDMRIKNDSSKTKF